MSISKKPKKKNHNLLTEAMLNREHDKFQGIIDTQCKDGYHAFNMVGTCMNCEKRKATA
jgi:hypothetical protein